MILLVKLLKCGLQLKVGSTLMWYKCNCEFVMLAIWYMQVLPGCISLWHHCIITCFGITRALKFTKKFAFFQIPSDKHTFYKIKCNEIEKSNSGKFL